MLYLPSCPLGLPAPLAHDAFCPGYGLILPPG